MLSVDLRDSNGQDEPGLSRDAPGSLPQRGRVKNLPAGFEDLVLVGDLEA
jgi:hypothetical protein